MKSPITLIQHVPFEGPARLTQWFERRNITCQVLKAYESFPNIDSIAGPVIVLGGPMSCYDDKNHPWLRDEKEFIKTLIESTNHKILGICLGAQLVAQALGATVTPNEYREIGWLPICLTKEAANSPLASLDPATPVMHWHGDTFSLPDNAVHLAYSEACKNQAFLWGERILGLQFHLEFDLQQTRALTQRLAEDLSQPGKYIQSSKSILNAPYFEPTQVQLFSVLDKFFLAL